MPGVVKLMGSVLEVHTSPPEPGVVSAVLLMVARAALLVPASGVFMSVVISAAV
jgi:hypothetical protein